MLEHYVDRNPESRLPRPTSDRGDAPRARGPRRPRRVRPLAGLVSAALLILALTPAAAAQSEAAALDVDTVLDNIAQAAEALEDVSFLLTGRLVDPDGTAIALEIDIRVVPDLPVASAYIIQPDALADNQIVLDGEAVYNYTFLTNQIAVFDANDPDALGGLLPAGEDGASASISFDLGAIFEGYVASVEEVFEGEHGPTYRIHFANRDPDALVLDVMALVPTADWLPRQLQFLQSDGTLLAELNAENMVIDAVLDPEDVRYLPEDAEIIDNRGN